MSLIFLIIISYFLTGSSISQVFLICLTLFHVILNIILFPLSEICINSYGSMSNLLILMRILFIFEKQRNFYYDTKSMILLHNRLDHLKDF